MAKKFGKKAKVVKSGGPDIDPKEWKAWNEYVYDKVMEITEDGDELSQVCFISGLVDTGIQDPVEKEREYDWEDTEKQHKLIKAGVGRQGSAEDGEEDKFFVKNRSNDTIVITVDFPSIMLDYSKHPLSNSEEEDLKPLRELLAGDWDNTASPVNLTPSKDGYNPKSRIATLCKVTGVKKGKVPKDFELGDLLGATFMMSVEASWGGDEDQFLNVKISNPANKPKAVPVPEHNIEPFAVLMDGDNEEEDLKQVNAKILRRLQLAEGFDKSPLKKELEKIGKLGGNSSSSESSEEEKPKKKAAKPKKVEQEPDEEPEDDEENPFK